MERVGRNSIRRTNNGDLNIVSMVGIDDVSFLIMAKGLDRRVVKRNDDVGKELINEFNVVRERKGEKWKKGRDDE